MSSADKSLSAEVEARVGIRLSDSKLERWRQAGWLNRNERHGLGRGQGSTSMIDGEMIDAATVLALYTRQGISLDLAGLAWFMWAGLPSPPHLHIPEPPHAPVRRALAAALRKSPSGMVTTPPDIAGEAALDLAAEAIADHTRRHHGIPEEFSGDKRRAMIEALTHLTTAFTLGPTEVGGDLLSAAFDAIGGEGARDLSAHVRMADNSTLTAFWILPHGATGLAEHVNRLSYRDIQAARAQMWALVALGWLEQACVDAPANEISVAVTRLLRDSGLPSAFLQHIAVIHPYNPWSRAMAWLLATISVMPAASQHMLMEIARALAVIAEKTEATQILEAPGAHLSTLLAATLELINRATHQQRIYAEP